MAYLNGSHRERAQVLLVTALILGVTFVALALILNSAIFTENLASRGETSGAGDVVGYHSDVKRGVGSIVWYENRNVSSGEVHADVFDRVTDGVTVTNDIMVRRHAKVGVLSNVSITGHEDGSRIYQTDHTRDFSNGTGQSDWTVADGVTRTRASRLNASRSGLSSACVLLTDCFILSITDGSNTWNVSVVDDVTGVVVRVDNESGSTEDCDPVNEPWVEVDLTAGTVAGEDCPALSFADVPNGPYDIEFVNGDKIEGAYSFVVDNDAIATSPPPHFGAGPEPSVTPALYDVTLEYEYRTVDLAVEKEIRVAPGEPDG